jgi:hypothetical protein
MGYENIHSEMRIRPANVSEEHNASTFWVEELQRQNIHLKSLYDPRRLNGSMQITV